MIEIQLAGLVFALFMIYLAYLHYKKGEYGVGSFAGWTIVWLIFLIVLTVPETFYGVMGILNITRTADFIVSVIVIFLLVATFNIYAITKKTERQMEKLVRQVAIKRK